MSGGPPLPEGRRTTSGLPVERVASWSGLGGALGTLTVIVTGGRDWTDAYPIVRDLDLLRDLYPLLTVVEGRARGADSIAGHWASDQRVHGVHHVPMSARWGDYPADERWRAGHDRNRAMVAYTAKRRDRGHGALVLAYKDHLADGLTIGGTEHCIRTALDAHLPVAWTGLGRVARWLLS